MTIEANWNKTRPKGLSSCIGKEIEPGKSFHNQTCRDVFYNQHPYDLAFSLPPLLIIPIWERPPYRAVLPLVSIGSRSMSAAVLFVSDVHGVMGRTYKR
jgi:hypothetical protein